MNKSTISALQSLFGPVKSSRVQCHESQKALMAAFRQLEEIGVAVISPTEHEGLYVIRAVRDTE